MWWGGRLHEARKEMGEEKSMGTVCHPPQRLCIIENTKDKKADVSHQSHRSFSNGLLGYRKPLTDSAVPLSPLPLCQAVACETSWTSEVQDPSGRGGLLRPGYHSCASDPLHTPRHVLTHQLGKEGGQCLPTAFQLVRM